MVAEMGSSIEGERTRLARLFAGYRDDPARQRAWSHENPGNAAIRRELATATLAVLERHDAGGAILDAGCGSGWWLEWLLRTGVPASRLVGADLLVDRVGAARARLPGVRVLCADVRSLPLEPASCALVTLFAVLSGMASRAQAHRALAEVRRVLAPGGAVVVWEPRVPTVNPDTRLVRLRDLRRALGPSLTVRSITLAPPIARRLARGHDSLAAIPALRSHRLTVARPR